MTDTAFLIVDVETTHSGNNMELGRMIAFGAIVIRECDISKVVQEQNGCVKFNKNNKLTFQDIGKLVPIENRIRIYIHDEEALKQIKDVNNPGDIWKEEKGQEFWLHPDRRDMLNYAIEEMQQSNLGPKEAMETFHKWFLDVHQRFNNNVILVSDTTNFDFPWMDNYYKKYLNMNSINHATSNGFVLPLDTGSYYFALTKQIVNLKNWDNFNSEKSLIEAGYIIPEIELGPTGEHDPLNDALKIGIRYACVVYQHNLLEKQKSVKRIRHE